MTCSAALAAPVASATPAQAGVVSTPPIGAPAGSLSLEERLTRLEGKVGLALEQKDARIDSINERSENVYKLLQVVAAIAALVLVLFSIREFVLRSREGRRQRGIDEIVIDMLKLQKSSAEQQIALGSLHLDKQRGVDEIVMDMLKLQKSSVEQQVAFGSLHLAQVEENPSEQFSAVHSVSQVIDVVKKTLDFRLEQDEKVADAFKEIERIRAERDRTKKQKLAHALSILEHFKKMSRMQFAALTDEQQKRGIRLQALANELGDFLDDKQEFETTGSLMYTCGVIAYYDNDVIESGTYLDRAAECRASDHDGELSTNQSYKYRFAFIHYFRALIQKNWGELSQALQEIEQSAKLLEFQPGEFLTPVTKAEILSYTPGSEDRCRNELQKLIEKIENLESALRNKGEQLDANQTKLRNRMLVLLGNTFFEEGVFAQALVQYTRAIELSPNDYYALASAAQCHRELCDAAKAADCFRRSLDTIERSGDFRRKRERITRAVIAVIAASAAKGCNESALREQYDREARELLSGNLAVDGMTPKFFSPSTKRLVSASDLVKELDL
jgi:tetratricopeptide (TPR) repeat protein